MPAIADNLPCTPARKVEVEGAPRLLGGGAAWAQRLSVSPQHQGSRGRSPSPGVLPRGGWGAGPSSAHALLPPPSLSPGAPGGGHDLGR